VGIVNDQEQHQKRKQLITEFKDELNSISPSMCLAKWKQVTLHLQTGRTHSCHHPSSHHIPVEEIKIDVSALHNTKFKKEQRKLMLAGERPGECDFCWRVEDGSPDGSVFSDRIMKSADYWARPHIDSISKSSGDESIDPSYLEVSFSNTCNFKCAYCSPEISSKWVEEAKQYGPYPTSNSYNGIDWLQQTNRMPIPEREDNPYVNAFWEWWPNLYSKLDVLRVTGGEPLLTKNTFKLLEHVLENPRPDLELNINSNLCIPDAQYDKFIELMMRILDKKAVKNFKLYTSCEATGQRAEYIRHGLNYNQWLDNCHKFMDLVPDSKLTVMATYNALSVTSFKDFLKDIYDLKMKYWSENDRHPIGLDVPFLKWPEFLSVQILTDDYLKIIEDQVTYMYQNLQQDHWPPSGGGKGFYAYEINRMERTYYVLDHRIKYLGSIHSEDKLLQNRKDFVLFVDEYDRRRNTSFLKTFPEMENFYNFCRKL
jgi:organic radical activating enzyme